MARGGKREGAGRKPGAATAKTRKIADRESSEGLTPLEVMLSTMREWHQQGIASRAGRRRERLITGAVSIAKDAAPYMHPKLSAVALVATPAELDPSEMTDAEIALRLAHLRGEKLAVH